MYSKLEAKYFRMGTDADKDPFYNSRLVTMLVNQTMRSGKKVLASKIVSKTLRYLEKHQQTYLSPVRAPLFLERSLRKIAPQIQFKSSKARVRKTRPTPIEIPSYKAVKIGLKWLVTAARARNDANPFHLKLAREIIASSKGKGTCIKRRKALHRRARNSLRRPRKKTRIVTKPPRSSRSGSVRFTPRR